ncbi:MAG: four helix bundle protein [Deltaproteobacteria bacterium]|nr:four helix bundle protein [Deltaproteobacteria bacterium]
MRDKKEGRSYRELEIYQLAHQIGVELHKFSLKLPKFELFETGDQLRRASKSMSANIVEGYGRRKYKAEFIRFLVYSHSSCNETIEWVEYIRDCHRDLKDEANGYLTLLDKLGRKINRFIRAVEKGHKT